MARKTNLQKMEAAAVDALVAAREEIKKFQKIEKDSVAVLKDIGGSEFESDDHVVVVSEEIQMRLDQKALKEFLGETAYAQFLKPVPVTKFLIQR